MYILFKLVNRTYKKLTYFLGVKIFIHPPPYRILDGCWFNHIPTYIFKYYIDLSYIVYTYV